MVLTKRVSHRGNSRAVLAAAREAFVAQGFAIERDYEYTFTARGPGMWSRQPVPLRGISRVQVSVTGDAIAANAELEALRGFQVMIIGAPLVMDTIASVVCGIVIAPWVGALVACGTILPYAFIGPFIARMFRKRTDAALDEVLSDAVKTK